MHCLSGISQQQSFPSRERAVLLPQSPCCSNEPRYLPQLELKQLLHNTPSCEGGMILRKIFTPHPSNAFTAPAPQQMQSQSSQITFPTRPPPTTATLFPRGSLGSIAGAAPRSQVLTAASRLPVLPVGRRGGRTWVAESHQGSSPLARVKV